MDDPRRRTPRTDVVLDSTRARRRRRDGSGARRSSASSSTCCGECREGRVSPDDVVTVVLASLPRSASSLREVVNATGVVVHTNLGRAPLSAAAVEAVVTAAGATDVELDLATGRRGPRGAGALAALAAAVPDAGGVHVVNNGAAALALVTSCLARGREVVVVARRAGRDRRRLPHPRAPRVRGRPTARGRDDEPGAARPTTSAPSATGDGVRPEGARVELPGRGLHLVGDDRRARDAGRAGGGRHRLRPAGAAPAAARRARRGDQPPRRSRPRHRLRRQAARRAAVRAAARARRPRPSAAARPARTGHARRQADARRARGHPHRPASTRRRGVGVTPERAARPRAPGRGDESARTSRRRCRPGRPSVAAAHPVSCSTARPSPCRRRLAEPLRLGDLPVAGHVVDGRLLLDLIAVPPERDDDLADAVRRAAEALRRALTCTSSPPPVTSTTASPRSSRR